MVYCSHCIRSDAALTRKDVYFVTTYVLKKTTNHMPYIKMGFEENFLSSLLLRSDSGLYLVHSRRDDISPSLGIYRERAEAISLRDLMLETLIFNQEEDYIPFKGKSNKRLFLSLNRGSDIYKLATLCTKTLFLSMLSEVVSSFVLTIEIVGNVDLGIPVCLESASLLTAEFYRQ